MTQTPAAPAPRVGVLVVAYNAASTLVHTLDRLPAGFRATVDHVLLADDASQDDTYAIGMAYRDTSDLPLTVVRHEKNLGYGGNQKAGYRWAIGHGLDVVVLLHGDGQYAPEVIEDLVRPLTEGRADAVFGSRMMVRGQALKGGMPLYKFVGNRILSTFQNAMTGAGLSEWHSGYRAYRVDALADLALDTYSDGFDFDTEIILGLLDAGKHVAEVPIPTYYGDEICYVNGMAYARDVARDVVRHRARRMGFGAQGAVDAEAYELKPSPHSSHGRILAWLAASAPGSVLDVGCSDGAFGALARAEGHRVVGVDVVKHDGVGARLDDFVEADLERGLPDEVGTGYDHVVAADVLEHVTQPEVLLRDIAARLAPGGEVLVSVPNFGHWYPRGRTALGLFDYDSRGPLDRGHVRFFTRRSFEKLVRECGLRIAERDVVGVPVDVLDRGRTGGRRVDLARAVGAADRAAVRGWPTLFGYQLLYRLEPA
ncbi:bifunctional glycosyltransferase/class I SAM-dependent methyltransferase [Phycicoccus sonneratiae]|uniref:Glycosyltransferase n=1 Tax=Phycicoccus sonneratiae TaxID=2807628 RepID=A0ABS2CI72_9MICO|nr:bifunctional glycosyltransferase/class I SAM-dependent methyltransferase [Phycicoccus sonneraticus]MBM6399490.1 glycosyltransferase [Phycicoccus sonneraticus]